jgi:metal-dependent HD superfamily phosphatase/phosphodiesterase
MLTSGELQLYRQALAKLQEQLEAFAAGTTNVSRMERGRWVDTTREHAEKVRRSIAHLESVLVQHGVAKETASSKKG